MYIDINILRITFTSYSRLFLFPIYLHVLHLWICL